MDLQQYEEWRRELVEQARAWAEQSIGAFLTNRLSFQRGKRGSETEDFEPHPNPEAALIENYIELRGEEADMWTPEEEAKIRRIMAACVAALFYPLVEGSPHQWADTEQSNINYFFGDEQLITLNEEEFAALLKVLERVRRTLEPRIREFKRPRK